MIDNYLLEELVTFKKYGTLASTAEHLMVTQPTVTRGMQKLEEELAVEIFDRQPNRITLTKTGELAAKEAQKVIDQNNNLITTVQKYEYNHKNIRIGAVAPGPLILLDHLRESELAQSKIDINDNLINPEDVTKELLDHNYSFVLTNQEIMTDDIESRFVGTEELSVNLNQFTLLANKKSVSFADLKGLSFIVIADIGIWKNITEKQIPNAKFLYQDQQEAFREITKYSDFPYFTTNISKIDRKLEMDGHDQVNVPIRDNAAKINFYAAYLKNQKKNINPILKMMNEVWDKYLN